MELLRYGHDAWGATVVNGVNWDLLGVAVGAGLAVVVVHALRRLLGRRNGG
ncbi:MAG: hypothetical protein RLZZ200_1401 [Pseudomonadota bacterium]